MTLGNVEEILRLSPTQSGMLFHSAAEPDAGVYVAQISCTLVGTLDVAAFKRAWDGSIRRHSALRAAFVWDGLDEPLQVIHKEVSPEWTELDWRDVPEANREEELRRRLEEDRRRGFDLAAAPLMRMLLIRLGEQSHRLVWTCHHILADGWSAAILLREILDRYRALSDGDPLELPPSTAFREYIAWLHGLPTAPAEEFWRSYLGGFDAPTSFPVGARQTCEERPLHQVLQRWLSEAESEALRQCARDLRLTLNTLVQGAWSILLHRYSGERDVISGATVAGRPAHIAGVEDAVGLFINTLPVRVDVDSGRRLGDWLADLQHTLLNVREHEHTSLVRIRDWSDLPPGEPLFDNLLVLENTPDANTQLHVHGLQVLDFRVLGLSNYPLAMLVTPDRRVELLLEHDPAVYGDESASRILKHFYNLLTAIPSSLDRAVGAIPLLSEEESRTLLVAWNDSGSLEPAAGTVLGLIARHAETSPSGAAVVTDGDRLSYGELESRSDEWARRLVACDVRPGDPVGICMERGVFLIAGILAIMKAGGAYVPLDPEYPRERLDFMMSDSGARLVLTHRALAGALSSDVKTLFVDVPNTGEDDTLLPAPDLPAVSEDLPAYVIYTSGSTGQPNGVPVSHRNLLHSTLARPAFYREPPAVFLLLSSASFDSSVAGIFWTLVTGGTLVVSKPRIEQDMGRLARCIAEHGVTHTLCLPSVYRLLLEHVDVTDLRSLKTVIAAGEPLPTDLVPRHRETLQEVGLFNEYGPTEATVWCSVFDTGQYNGEPTVPIGRPITGTRIYLLDREGRPVPVGVPGEIHVAGEGLTGGYLNRPEATARRFVEREIGGERTRLYRTGDVGRYGPDGNIEFLGRLDGQIKIRGFRVEPREIEAALERHEMIREAVVVPAHGSDVQRAPLSSVAADTASNRSDRPQPRGQTITAFLTLEGAADRPPPTPAELRDHLQGLVPRAMIPSSFRILNSFTRLPNGKIDTAALADLPDQAPEAESDWTPPRNEVERMLGDIWCDVLQLEEISVHDTFFELGGDSILSIRVTSRANQRGLGLSPNDIFNFPTIAELATRCTGRSPEWGSALADPLETTSDGADRHPVKIGGRPPLFMVHLGIRLAARLRYQLGRDQPLFCFSAHWHRADMNPNVTVEQLAAECLTELRTLQPSGPYFIGGYSMGAPIALELAQMVQRQGEEVRMLFALDPPVMAKSLETDGSDHGSADGDVAAIGMTETRSLGQKLSSQVRTLSGLPQTERAAYLWNETVAQIRWRVLRPLKVISAVALRQIGLGVPPALREPYVSMVYSRARRDYRFMPYHGDVVIFNGRGAAAREAVSSWRALTRGTVDVETFEGAHHDFVMDPELVDRWAERLAAVLAARQCEEPKPA